MRERLINQGQTTLNGAIDGSTTSVVVTDGSVFPSAGQFRVVVDNEIMLVTSRSSNTLTVVRGSESSGATSHSDAADIVQGLTVGSVQQFVRDWCDPFADVTARKPMQLLDGTTTLTGSDFSDVNMTNVTKTDVNGMIVLEHDTQGSAYDIGIIDRAAPSAPWVLTVGIIPNLLNAASDFPSCGLVVRDGTGGELYFHKMEVRAAGTYIKTFKHASPTSTEVTFLSRQNFQGAGVLWLQAEDDNVDLIFRVSADGVNFLEVGREARTAYLTPDRIGIGIDNWGNAAVKAMVTLVSWDIS